MPEDEQRSELAALLAQPAQEDYREQWKERLAGAEEAVDRHVRRWVLFRLGAEWFVLPVGEFVDISEVVKIHSVPYRRGSCFLGLANLRGGICLCFSIHRLLGLEADGKRGKGRRIYPRILRITREEETYAFPVDEVGGIRRVPVERMEKAPATVDAETGNLTRGMFHFDGKAFAVLESKALVKAFKKSME